MYDDCGHIHVHPPPSRIQDPPQVLVHFCVGFREMERGAVLFTGHPISTFLLRIKIPARATRSAFGAKGETGKWDSVLFCCLRGERRIFGPFSLSFFLSASYWQCRIDAARAITLAVCLSPRPSFEG